MIIALHGFLGLPQDWELVAKGFMKATGGARPLWTPDLWSEARRISESGSAPENGFQAWTDSFLNQLHQQQTAHEATDAKPILMGYSLGGRLAMHAVIASPESFRALVLISAHPGLQDEKERGLRRESDAQWMSKFADAPWQETLAEWNAQGVLAPSGLTGNGSNSIALERNESEFDRRALAAGMGIWSLGRQKDLRKQLRQLPMPVLYLTGGRDRKFTSIYSNLAKAALQRHLVLLPAGHRLPWDEPKGFRTCVQDFLLEALDFGT